MSLEDSHVHASKPSRPLQGRGLSLTQKLLALMGSTTVTVVLVLTAFFLKQQISASHAALQRKAAAYGALSARQVAPAVAFDDRETAREVFDAVALDDDIESMTLFNAAGEVLHARGAAGAWIAAAKGGVQEQKLVELEDRIAVVSPVVSAEGPRGTLVVELSTRKLQEAIASMTRTAVAVGLLAILMGMVLAYAIARSLGRRLGSIAKAAVGVAGGDFEQPALPVEGSDEVTHLAHGFNTMMREIQRLFAEARATAASERERLETLVDSRTQELDHRNADMRMVLDNVGQGFLTVGLDGQMSRERSAIVGAWLGESREGETFFQYVDRALPGKGDYLRVGWEALSEDWMPLEMRLSQLPAELQSERFHLGFSYQPIFEAGALHKLVVIVSDIAPLMERRRAEDEERELVQVVRKLLSDHRGFQEYTAEASQLVKEIVDSDPDLARRKRLLHTLKGNSAIFGFESMVRLCHELEDNMQTSGGDLSESDKQRLQDGWNRLDAKMNVLMGERSPELLEVKRTDVQHVVANINAGARPSLITHLIHSWELEPTEARLTRLGDYAQALATRLDKSPMHIDVTGNDVRLHPTDWVGFWQALVHVVRNAVDHGLEGASTRRDSGKPEAGRLQLRTTLANGLLQVSIEDDGAGIDWARVAEAAKKRGLPHATQQQLIAAVMADGTSTKETASHTSGRGLGLSAVREACEAIGGSVDIQSERGGGTRFCFSFAVDALGRPSIAALPSKTLRAANA